MKKLRKKWNAFWYKKEFAKEISFFRILVGIIILLQITGLYGISRFPFDVDQGHFLNYMDDESSYFLTFFNVKPSFFAWLPTPTFEQFHLLEGLFIITSLFLTIGFLTRIVTPLTTILFGFLFFQSEFFYHHYLFLLFNTLLILSFSHCGDYYSVDSLFSKKKRFRRSKLPLRLLQFLASFVYFFSFIAKLNQDWFTGNMFRALYIDGRFQSYFGELVFQSFSFQLLGILTVFVMPTIMIGLWIPKFRTKAILLGIFVHLGIDAIMHVATFSYQMIVFYTLYDPFFRNTRKSVRMMFSSLQRFMKT